MRPGPGGVTNRLRKSPPAKAGDLLPRLWRASADGHQYDALVKSPPLDRFLLGPERVLWAADGVAPLNFCVVVELEGPLTIGALRMGLRAAQRRHGALQCGVALVDDRPRFVPVEEPIAVSLITSPSWTPQLVGELDTAFDVARGPLLRVRWIRGGEVEVLLFTFHHAVADGRSGMVIATEVLATAAARLRGAPLPVYPPPQLLVPEGSESAPHPTSPVPRLVDGGQGPRGRRTLVLTHRFGLDETVGLRTAARRLGATVHGLLCATHLAAVAEEHGHSVPLLLSCPADLRSGHPGAEDAIGVLLGNWLQAYRVDPHRGVPSLAVRISSDIRRAVERGLHWPAESGPVDLEALYAARASTAVSNLGVVRFPAVNAPLVVHGVHFAVACSALGDQIVTATTFAGRLTWSFCASTPTLSPSRARRIAGGSIERLSKISGRWRTGGNGT